MVDVGLTILNAATKANASVAPTEAASRRSVDIDTLHGEKKLFSTDGT